LATTGVAVVVPWVAVVVVVVVTVMLLISVTWMPLISAASMLATLLLFRQAHISLSLFLSPLFPLFIWIFANCSCANSLFLCFVFLFRDGQKFGESKFEIIDICQAYTTLRNEMSFLACVLI